MEKINNLEKRIARLIELSDWKTIGQREESQRSARRWKRRGYAVAAAGGVLGGANAAASGMFGGTNIPVASQTKRLHKAQWETDKILQNSLKTKLKNQVRLLPTPAKIAGGAILGGLAVSGAAKGVDRHHQKKINERRKSHFYRRQA